MTPYLRMIMLLAKLSGLKICAAERVDRYWVMNTNVYYQNMSGLLQSQAKLDEAEMLFWEVLEKF